MTLDPGLRLGPYEIMALLGTGSMGEVYRARDTRLHRDVAIKILASGVADSPTRRARFEREAQAISRLSHPNICAIYDVGEHDGGAFLVMEYMDGETLEERLRLGPLATPVALRTAIEIAAALDAAHDRGIVHRDLKPANVMLAPAGVKLLDFGIAKLIEEDDGSAAANALLPTRTLTAEHKIIGTLNYMAPEQLEGLQVDRRADVFALGAVLYEMLTGRKAFGGSSSASVTAAVLTAEPPALASIVSDDGMPPALDHVIRRALAKKADDRWQTARDAMHELRWILDGAPRAIGRPAAPGRARRRLGLALGAMIIAAFGVASGWRILRSAPEPSNAPLAVFTIAAPEGARFGPGYGMLAVSPDGLKVAFTATQGSGQSIWVRYLESPFPERLPNTEGGNSPFWSPDSQSVGFFADNDKRIERVTLSGGQPRLVTTVKAGLAASTWAACWMADDTIVFAQEQGLVRVQAAGGEAVAFAAPDTAKNERAYLMPSLLSDGRLLFLVRRNFMELSESQIATASGARAITLPTVRSNAVLASEHLIFRQGTSLVAQPFDQRALRLTGQPVLIAEGVDYNPANGRTVFSASADVLAYRTEAPLKLTWIDRSGRRLGSVGEVGRDWNLALASDGSGRVAVDRFDVATGTFHISTIDDQGRSTPLTHGAKDRFPLWSPDGQWIAYLTPSVSGSDLHRIRASGAGGEEVLLRTEPLSSIPLDWSRDGRFIVYESGGDLWALPITEATRTPVQLTKTPGRKRQARLSPDGKWLAYAVADGAGPNMWIQSFPNPSAPQRISSNTGFDPSWRQDGREFYYITSDGKVMAVPVGPGTPPAFGSPVMLFQIEPGAIHVPLHVVAATPDGQRFLVSEPVQTDHPITVVVHWPKLVRE